MEDKATQTPEQTFSMEAALQETEARLEKRVRPGQILTGKVVLVGSEGVAVDIGANPAISVLFNICRIVTVLVVVPILANIIVKH